VRIQARITFWIWLVERPGQDVARTLGESDARVFPHNDADFQQKLGEPHLEELASLIIISMEGIVRPASILARVEGESRNERQVILVRRYAREEFVNTFHTNIVGFLLCFLLDRYFPTEKAPTTF